VWLKSPAGSPWSVTDDDDDDRCQRAQQYWLIRRAVAIILMHTGMNREIIPGSEKRFDGVFYNLWPLLSVTSMKVVSHTGMNEAERRGCALTNVDHIS